MNSKLSCLIGVTVGALIGSSVTYKIIMKNFENRIHEEVKSVKETYKKEYEKEKEDAQSLRNAVFKQNTDVCEKPNVEVTNYKDYANKYKSDEEKEVKPAQKYEIISPEEYGENPEFVHHISMTYYSGDNVLTYDNGEIVDDPEEIIGPDALSSFGEYEDDSVHVRNYETKAEYEILLDDREYYEVFN